jgi:hypothetical protein
VIYNGDGYDPEWPANATKQGVWRIDSGVPPNPKPHTFNLTPCALNPEV